MAGNTMTITFAGDALKLQRAAKDAKDSLDKVGKAAQDVDDTFGKVGNGIDGKTGRIRQKLAAFGEGLVDTLQGAAGKLPGVLSGAVGSLPPQGQAVALAVVGGLTAALAPMIGAAITAAILLGVGGGALALGIKSAMDNPKVASAFGGLKKKASSIFEGFGKPFEQPLIRAAKTFEGVLDRVSPSIDRIGAVIAPVIDKLAPALGEFFENVMPGIEDAVRESTPLFDTLAEHLPGIGKSLGEFFTWISEHGDEASTFFGDMLTVIEFTITAVGWVIAYLTAQYMTVRKILVGFKDAALAVGRWFRDTLWGRWIKGAWDGIIDGGKAVWKWMKDLPGRLKGAFASIAGFLSAPFRSAFNRIADAWNSTVGRLSWTVPGWIPGIGGNSISVPHIPKFHSGGTVPGVPGSEMLAVLQAGETVTPAGGGGDLVIRSGGTQLDDLLVEILARAVRRRGGNVQHVLGSAHA